MHFHNRYKGWIADEPNTYSKGLGSDTLSRPVCNPYYKQPHHGNTAARH
jgi:hypothetical protein